MMKMKSEEKEEDLSDVYWWSQRDEIIGFEQFEEIFWSQYLNVLDDQQVDLGDIQGECLVECVKGVKCINGRDFQAVV